jgi:UDP-N-acetylglucosamine--N-acetylmuramyl-(pentapeptide) pyrophosphoryl-undecaprenol N-acetylglucosamine transferase
VRIGEGHGARALRPGGAGPVTTLLVASEGGHLVELYQLSEFVCPPGDRVWVTFDTPQSRSLLAGQDVRFAPFVGTRDLVGTARAARWARGFLRSGHFDTVISTGAGIALAVLPLASRMGADCYYIESATRTDGPSLTGRLLTPFRSLHLRTQHERWADQRWLHQVSVFDGFHSFPLAEPAKPRSMVVSLGIHRGFGFRRLLERLVQIIPDDVEVLWQAGHTDTSGMGIDAHVSLPAPELSRAMVTSDVVLTHAGIGSVFSALQAGKHPVVAPRRKQFNEHVDDHQAGIARELDRLGLVTCVDAGKLEWADIVRAASWRVERDAAGELARLGAASAGRPSYSALAVTPDA